MPRLLSGASGTLFLKDGPGTLILGGNNSYANGTSVGQGVLGLVTSTSAGTGRISFGALGDFAAFGDNLVIANAIIGEVVTDFNTNGDGLGGKTVTLTGRLANETAALQFGVNKIGAGTLNLDGQLDYTGATTVTAGTLNINSAVDSNVTVAAGAILGGTGTIGPANTVTVNGGSINPGASPGTITMGNLDLAAGSTLNFELAQAGVEGGGINDLIIVTNNLNITGATAVNPIALTGFNEGTYRLINFGGTGAGLNLLSVDPAAIADFTLSLDILTPNQVNLISTFNGTRFWDGAGPFGDGTVDGGTATWATGTTNWTNLAGLATVAWANTAGIFAGNAGTVTVDGTQGFTSLEFRTAGYTLTDGTLNHTAGTIFANNAGTTTINSAITGSGGLTKTGAGTLVLGGANSFTGGYTSGADTGVTVAGTSTALGVGTANFGANTTLRTAGLGSVILANNIDYTGPFTIDVPVASLVLDGVISGTGALSFTGPGNGTISPFVRLDTANSFTGAVTATNVHLSADADARLGNLANTLTFDNSTFSSNPAFTSSRGITLIGENRFLQNGTMTLNGVIQGTGRLNQAGPQTLVLTNAGNSFSGGVEISSGTLSVASDAALGAVAGGISFTNDTNFILTPQVLQFTANVTSARAIDIQSTVTGTINTVANDVTLSGPITGAGTLGKAGSGRLTLTGTANAYTGGTNLTAGTLRIAESGSLGTGTLTTTGGTTFVAGIANNAAITLAATQPIVLGAGNTTIDLVGGSFSINTTSGVVSTNGTTLTIDGVISGDGGFTTANAGILNLNAINSYSGGTTLSNVAVNVGNTAALGTGLVTMNNFSAVQNNTGVRTLLNDFNIAGSASPAVSSIVLGGNGELAIVGALSGPT